MKQSATTLIQREENLEMNQYRHPPLDSEEPEHLDSFYETPPLASGRILAWNKTQDQFSWPSSHIKMQPLSLRREHGSRHRSNFSNNSIDERWPNSTDVLPSVRPTFIEEGNRKVFVYWSLPKRKQQNYLPHYRHFVHTKLLHPRASTSEGDGSENHRTISTIGARPRGAGFLRYGHKTRPVKTGLNAHAISATDNSLASHCNVTLTARCSRVAESTSLSGAFTEAELAAFSQPTGTHSFESDIENSCLEDLENSTSYRNLSTNSGTLTIHKSEDITAARKVHRKPKKCRRTEKGLRKGISGNIEDIQDPRDLEQILPASPLEEIPAKETTSDLDVADVVVPDLPSVCSSVPVSARTQQRGAGKHQINTRDARKSRNPPVQITDEPVLSFDIFGDLEAATILTNSNIGNEFLAYTSNRMFMSQPTSRFELPIDLKSLEYLSPQEYLRTYCKISSLSRKLCLKVFNKYRNKAGKIQGKGALLKVLDELLVSTITEEQGRELCALLEIDDDTPVDPKLFLGMMAVAERMIEAGRNKEMIEHADFHSLNWKLLDLHINNQMRMFLESLS